MATLIRLKRKKTSGTTNEDSVKLRSGEPIYNLEDKKLYIGNTTANDSIAEKIPEAQKHITEVTDENTVEAVVAKNGGTAVDSGDATVSFSVGEATDNVYRKTVNNVNVAKGIVLSDIYYGNETKRTNLANHFKDGRIPPGTVFFQEAE